MDMDFYLNLSFSDKKVYLEKIILDNQYSFDQMTKLFMDKTDTLVNADQLFFDAYLKIFIQLYDENSTIFSKDDKPIFSCKEDLSLYLIFSKIAAISKDSSSDSVTFFKEYLADLSEYGIDSFNFIEGSKEKGFSFDYLLYIPKDIENNTLIVEGNNVGINNTKGELKNPIYLSETLPVLGSFKFLLDFKTPIFVPLIPNNNSTISTEDKGYEKYARQLSRNTVNPDLTTNKAMTSEDDDLYRMDLQLMEAIKSAKEFVYKKTGTKLEEKSLLYGFSTSGNLAVRLAFLHPEEFCGVLAGGINAAIPLPFPTYQDTKLIYPVGTYDYEMITGKDFDYDTYMNLPQYYFMGDSEEQSEYNTVTMPLLHDKEVTDTYSVLSLDLYERLDNINHIYHQLGMEDDRIEVYENCGHKYSLAVPKIRKLASSWLHENQKEDHKVR